MTGTLVWYVPIAVICSPRLTTGRTRASSDCVIPLAVGSTVATCGWTETTVAAVDVPSETVASWATCCAEVMSRGLRPRGRNRALETSERYEPCSRRDVRAS